MATTAGDDDSNEFIFYFPPINQHLARATRFCHTLTTVVTAPLALVCNGLSLITFVRMYRAKQQVTSKEQLFTLYTCCFICSFGYVVILPLKIAMDKKYTIKIDVAEGEGSV